MKTRTGWLPLWGKFGLASLTAGVGLCIGALYVTRSFEAFIVPLLACALPFAALVTFIGFLATAGKRSRRMCGYCGYDRVGLRNQDSCPECGRTYSSNAPGYQAVGKRAIPVWIWLPALLPIPALLFVRFTGHYGGYYMVGCHGVLGLILLAGAAHAWKQAR